jgi:hypothetical protein
MGFLSSCESWGFSRSRFLQYEQKKVLHLPFQKKIEEGCTEFFNHVIDNGTISLH